MFSNLCFKRNKGEYLRLKNYERKTKSLFMIIKVLKVLNIACYQLTINFRNFAQKGLSAFHKVWAAEKKIKSCFDIRATATEWINGI